MKVYVNKITGIDDAMVSLLMSKRSYTREKEIEIRQFYAACSTADGRFWGFGKDLERWSKDLATLEKWGVDYGHTTLLRYIDISITVEGLHRFGQDDLDSHAARMNNRIVRASTRLGKFKDGEVSEYYEDKILFPFQALEAMGIEIPEVVNHEGSIYERTDYGYVRNDHRDNQDVKRGLYPGAIPSNFTFKIQLPELAHIYQHRCDHDGHANPEVIKCVEMIREQLKEIIPVFAEWLPKITTGKPYTE